MTNKELAKLLYENENGMILKESSTGIQTITQDYIEYLLENNGLSREDSLRILSKCVG